MCVTQTYSVMWLNYVWHECEVLGNWIICDTKLKFEVIELFVTQL